MASSSAEITSSILSEYGHGDAHASLKAAVRNLADQARDYAKTIAPVGGDEDRHPGQFRDGFESEDAPDRKGLPAARVRNDTDGAAAIEFGTSRTPEHGTLAKTAEHFGVTNPRVNEYKSGARVGQPRV